MTPAIQAARQSGIAHWLHEYSHDPASSSYGLEAVEKLGLSQERVFKTLMVSLDGKGLAVAVLPVGSLLNMKRVAKAAGAKKAAMADPVQVVRSSGYVLGGVSPLGQKKALPTFIDTSALVFPTVFVSGGRRGLEIELSPLDLGNLVKGHFVELCPPAHPARLQVLPE